jgi:hypothetical protein
MARDNRSLTVTALFQAFAIIRYRNSEQEYLVCLGKSIWP